MRSPTPRSADRLAAAGVFEDDAPAQQAAEALRAQGIGESQISRLSATNSTDLRSVLSQLGVADGEARFYAGEVQAGRTLVMVVDVDVDQGKMARTVLHNHGGYDVQSRGGALAAGEGGGVPGGTGARPVDLTGRWEDVASRYEMLWGQHYGTGDADWEQMAPTYHWAWQAANEPQRRGRPWAEVEGSLRSQWESSGQAVPWSEVSGPIRDVWDDVAEEAATGAEGGQDRRIPRQGTDQTVAARQVLPPS